MSLQRPSLVTWDRRLKKAGGVFMMLTKHNSGTLLQVWHTFLAIARLSSCFQDRVWPVWYSFIRLPSEIFFPIVLFADYRREALCSDIVGLIRALVVCKSMRHRGQNQAKNRDIFMDVFMGIWSEALHKWGFVSIMTQCISTSFQGLNSEAEVWEMADS